MGSDFHSQARRVKKGFLSAPGTHRERRIKGERKREEEVEEEDEVEAEGQTEEHGAGGGADEGGEGEERAEEGHVQELPLAESCRHFAVIAWEGVSGSVSHLSHIPPPTTAFIFFFPL